MPKEKKVDPIRGYKRQIWSRAKGMSDTDRLDFYIHERQGPKAQKDASSAQVEFLDKRIQALLRRLALPFYLTSDNKYEAFFEPVLGIRNEKDARKFRRFVRQRLGAEEASRSVLAEIKYRANPEVVKKLGDEGKAEFCHRHRKERFICRAATDITLQGKRQ